MRKQSFLPLQLSVCLSSEFQPTGTNAGRGSHQHWVHFDPSTLQVLPDSGHFIIGQVGCVVIVQLQQALQLIFCFIADVLMGFKKQVSSLIMLDNRLERPMAKGIKYVAGLSGLLKIPQASDPDLFWCSILPVQPPLLPVWTHHVSDYRLGCK